MLMGKRELHFALVHSSLRGNTCCVSSQVPDLTVLFTGCFTPKQPPSVHIPHPDWQMNTETEDDFYQSEDDLDEDEATQYIIEQSLIQYRKLKGLNPR